MLGDDALIYSPPAAAVDDPAARARGGDRAGQHRPGPARPGAAAARPGRPAEGVGPAGPGREDQLAFFRDEQEFRNVRLAEHARRATSPSSWAACWSSPPGGWRCCGRLTSLAPTRCSRHRRQGRQGARLPPRLRRPLGGHGSATAPTAVAREDAGRARRVWPLAGELFQPDPVSRAGCPAWPSTRRTCATRSTTCWTPCSPRPPGPPAGRPAGPGRGRAGRDGVHTEAMGYSSPSCRPSPAPTRTRHGDRARAGRRAAARAVAAAAPDPELPMLTIGGPRHPARRRLADRGTVVTITPTYSGCPAHARDRARRLRRRLRGAGLRRRHRRTALRPAWTTDWITADGHRKLADAGIAPPPRPPRRRPPDRSR